MNKLPFKLLFLSIFLIGYYSPVLSAEVDDKKPDSNTIKAKDKQQPKLAVLSLDMRILPLLALSEHDAASTEQKLIELSENPEKLNLAEQYLILLIRANIAFEQQQFEQALQLLKRAISFEEQLADKQLTSPSFAKVHKLLALTYQQMGQYQQAYLAKKTYIKRHFGYLKQQKDLRVRRLNQKYQMQKRREENELLEQRNQLKKYEIEKADVEKREQYRNILLVVLTGLVFLILIIRQFKQWRAIKIHNRTDALTQLANRRSFFYLGNDLMEHAINEKEDFCILMVHVDNPNVIDEDCNFSHDDLIKCVAELASETMRSRDILARIANQEFAAILPEANIKEARAIAERMREKIHLNSKNKLECCHSITLSIGIASINDINTSFDDLVDGAGIAMHHVMLNGHNQICNYPVSPRNTNI